MKRLLIALVLLAGAGFVLYRSGHWLMVERPEKSDAIVVLAGDVNDVRYWRALQLLRDGYGRQLLLDASADQVKYGRSYAQTAEEFVRSSAGELASSAGVCPIRENSTVSETKYVAACLAKLRPRSVLLVTSDFHTRRALSIFARKLPQYHWSVAAAQDANTYGPHWWQHREWAKNWVGEWERNVWWNLADRWR